LFAVLSSGIVRTRAWEEEILKGKGKVVGSGQDSRSGEAESQDDELLWVVSAKAFSFSHPTPLRAYPFSARRARRAKGCKKVSPALS